MHEMGGFDIRKARELFKIPDDYEIGIMIALGYQDNIDAMSEKYREKAHLPRERKSLSEIAFLGDKQRDNVT
jgi:hypothetical protein